MMVKVSLGGPAGIGPLPAPQDQAPRAHSPGEVGLGPLGRLADRRETSRRDLQTLRSVIEGHLDPAEGLRRIHMGGGLPIVVDGKTTFVSDDPEVRTIGGDFNQWQPQPMQARGPVRVLEVEGELAGRYKCVDAAGVWASDPWSRAYGYDEGGEISLIRPQQAHLQRFHLMAGFGLPPRTVRVWVPKERPTHHLYAQDGQNLFDPGSMWGGWNLQAAAGDHTLIIGIDNSGQGRFDEYTHTQDRIGESMMGGQADAYADFVLRTVRPHIEATYGAARKVGILGSSLGGLAAFHAVSRHPNAFDFVGAMSATFGWGQMGDGVNNETMIDRFREQPRLRRPKFYIDSGGEPGGADNYDVTTAMARVLSDSGYRWNKDLWHWHEPAAPHRETAWAARAHRPLQLFESL